ncbi:MAG: alpha/beta fold hydrolase [Sulfuricella sp.]|nr:alpha/beta fold hydrolase [Sulfuricella sp.]
MMQRLPGSPFRRQWHCAALLGLAFLPLQRGWAETVEQRLPGGTIAAAEWRAGQPAKPAVLLLHGFLQTRQAPPMSRLAGTLADQGYTVLAPTLSLGIDRRAQSLACEAVHAHTLEGDVAEVGLWVSWLAGKGYRTIVLVGHSFGSEQILRYVAQRPDVAVKKAILTSLVPLHSDGAERREAVAQIKSRPQTLGRFTLAYCHKNYAAPPAAFLSYAAEDASVTLNLLRKTQVPAEVILGGADTAMDKGWPGKVGSSGARLAVIAHAGHFFDGEQEFDLADTVGATLAAMAGN